MLTVEWLFIEAAFHRSSFSSKRLFIEAAFHRSSFSLNAHRGGFSLNLHISLMKSRFNEKLLHPFSQHFICCVPYEWAQ
jgi:hypothetical protein